MAGKIFINYRRDLSLKDARLLHAYLGGHFPPKRLFLDDKDINGGVSWLQELGRQVAASDIMLALIAEGWEDIRDGQGARRLDDRDDFVRFEIAEALKRDIKLVPVLIDGAGMPKADDLPQDIRLLAYQQAMPLRTESFAMHVGSIAGCINERLAQQRRYGVPVWQAVAGAVVTAAFAAGLTAGALLLPEKPGTASELQVALTEIKYKLAALSNPEVNAWNAAQPFAKDPAFTRWTEQYLQLVFNSLTGKTKEPLNPGIAARMLSVSLAIGCLVQDASQPAPDLQTLTAGKDFAQIEKDVAGLLASRAVSGRLCRALKLQFSDAGGVK